MRQPASALTVSWEAAVAKKTGSDGRRNNRPPVSGPFKPGQSGNKHGRKRGSRNHRTELIDQLNRMVVVTENSKRVRKTKWAVIVAQQINSAMARDLKAAQFLAEQRVKHGLLVESETEPARLRAIKPSTPSAAFASMMFPRNWRSTLVDGKAFELERTTASANRRRIHAPPKWS
jgi:hypothetical protein